MADAEDLYGDLEQEHNAQENNGVKTVDAAAAAAAVHKARQHAKAYKTQVQAAVVLQAPLPELQTQLCLSTAPELFLSAARRAVSCHLISTPQCLDELGQQQRLCLQAAKLQMKCAMLEKNLSCLFKSAWTHLQKKEAYIGKLKVDLRDARRAAGPCLPQCAAGAAIASETPFRCSLRCCCIRVVYLQPKQFSLQQV